MKSKFHWQEMSLFLVALLPVAYLGYIYPHLPEIVPTHFGADGKANAFSPKASLWFWVFLLSVLSIFLYLLMKSLPAIDPKKNAKYSAAAFNKIGVALVLFLCAMNLFLIHASLNTTLSFSKALPVLIGCFFTFMGNLMPTLKPNYFAGIRTPWTLENDETWRKTHRLAGRFWFAGGILIIIEGLILPPTVSLFLMIAIIFISVIIPVVYSYRYYKSLPQKHN
ncbi:MAG TPA: SdpI family protein [Puia sp.]|nr:SdpI family protein [Puia sp.]